MSEEKKEDVEFSEESRKWLRSFVALLRKRKELSDEIKVQDVLEYVMRVEGLSGDHLLSLVHWLIGDLKQRSFSEDSDEKQ